MGVTMIVASPHDDAQTGFQLRLRNRLRGGFVVLLNRSTDLHVSFIHAGLSERCSTLHPRKNLTESLRSPSCSDATTYVEDRFVVGYSDQAPFASPNHFPYTKTTSEFLGNFLFMDSSEEKKW